MKSVCIGDMKLEVPIIQGGMGVGISLGNLAGHVAKNGGMGVISTAHPGYRAEDFEKNPTAYRRFCWHAAYLFETAGQNGSDYFMKAFKAQREIGMLFKYILSKLRLYMPLSSCIDKWRR